MITLKNIDKALPLFQMSVEELEVVRRIRRSRDLEVGRGLCFALVLEIPRSPVEVKKLQERLGEKLSRRFIYNYIANKVNLSPQLCARLLPEYYSIYTPETALRLYWVDKLIQMNETLHANTALSTENFLSNIKKFVDRILKFS